MKRDAGHSHDVIQRVREQLLETGQSADPSTIASLLSSGLIPAGSSSPGGAFRGPGAVREAAQAIQRELTGVGPLAQFVETPGVTDVLVTSDGSVWVDQATGLSRTEMRLEASEVARIAVRILGRAGRALDTAHPYGDAVVDGYRVHAVLPPIVDSPVLSIRVPNPAQARLGDILTGPQAAWVPILKHVVERRETFMISGGTGAGKTTLLAGMLAECRGDDRLIMIEDSRELRPAHPHAVSMQARQPNAEGAGEVSLQELVRQALRMRPDRLIVGECRGAEIQDLLMALNTGHRGAGATVHANSINDVPARLLALGSLAGWQPHTTALQAASAIGILIHVERTERGRGPVALGSLRLTDTGSLDVDLRYVAGASGAPQRVEPSDERQSVEPCERQSVKPSGWRETS